MKKINFSRCFKNQRVYTFAFMLGLLFLGNLDVKAQDAAYLNSKVNDLTTLQATFAPGSAKHDIVKTAIDYLNWVDNNLASNPNFIADTPGVGDIRLTHQLRKTHPSILEAYSTARLAGFQSSFDAMSQDGINPDPGVDENLFTKIKWILEANSY